MPTPPPWWIDTHVAPDEALTRALSSGQSAIASEPSAIASVSRYGEATEPESRWSRPITIGALISPGGDHLVEPQPGDVALAVAEPADPGRQPLERDLVLGGADPALQVVVLREQLEDGAVGGGDVLRVAGERGPAERALALAEQRPDVGGHEAGEGERALVAALAGLVADRVAVVEDLGAGVQEADHRLDVLGHRGPRPVGELLGLLLRRSRASRRGRRPRAGRLSGSCARGLVGDDVDLHAAAQQLGEHRRRRCRPARPTAAAGRAWRPGSARRASSRSSATSSR